MTPLAKKRIDVEITRRGLSQVAIFGDLEIEASPAPGKQSVVPAVLTVRHRHGDVVGDVVDTDECALARAKRRGNFLDRPAIRGLRVEPQELERVLLELCAAVRTDRATNGESSAGTHLRTPAIVPFTPLGDVVPATMGDLRALIDQRLMLGDSDVLDVVLGTVKSHRASTGSPCWLMVVGPPSGLKSETVMLAREVAGTYTISGLTSKTFASGLKVDKGQANPSLLSKLQHDEILLFKDFTTVLQMHREERDAILGQLREIYDGTYTHDWGTGERLEWTGRLGFVAGVTEAIDQHHAVMALLGPRFLLHRPSQANRQATARRAIRNNENREDGAIRAMHARAVAAYLDGLPTRGPALSESVVDTLGRLADFVTTARSSVGRDGHSRELTYSPLPECPPRFAQQVATLLTGIVLVHQHRDADADDLRLAIRVALDCVPPIRLLALRTLLAGDQDLTTRGLAHNVRVPTTTIRRAMEDLEALGLVHCEKGGHQNRWSLLPLWRGMACEFLTPVPAIVDTLMSTDRAREVVI